LVEENKKIICCLDCGHGSYLERKDGSVPLFCVLINQEVMDICEYFTPRKKKSKNKIK